MNGGVLLLVILGLIALALVVGTLKGWVSWRGGKGIATLTAFHDLQPKDKQEAIEIIVEKKAGMKWSEQESGEKKPLDEGAGQGEDRK